MNTITAAQLQSRLADGDHLQLIDVRTLSEYAQGHLPGALNLPLNDVRAREQDISRHGTLVLICQSGTRAQMGCAQLGARENPVLVLEGGTVAWAAAGLPVVGTLSRSLPVMRQTQLIAGVLVLTGALLSLYVRTGWIALALLVGSGLTLAGSTGFCPMASLLAHMPWNRVAAPGQ